LAYAGTGCVAGGNIQGSGTAGPLDGMDLAVCLCWPCLPCVGPLDAITGWYAFQDYDILCAIQELGGLQKVVEVLPDWEGLSDGHKTLVTTAIASGAVGKRAIYLIRGESFLNQHYRRSRAPQPRTDLLAPSSFFSVSILAGDKVELWMPLSWPPGKKRDCIQEAFKKPDGSNALPDGDWSLTVPAYAPCETTQLTQLLVHSNVDDANYCALQVLANIPAAHRNQHPDQYLEVAGGEEAEAEGEGVVADQPTETSALLASRPGSPGM
jgi:hypothetical protein